MRFYKYLLLITIVFTFSITGMINLLPIPLAQAGKPVDPTLGTLSGKVTIAGLSTPIIGASITAVGLTKTYTALTNKRGTYTLSLPQGTYDVTASATGYKSQTKPASIRAGLICFIYLEKIMIIQ